MFAHTATSEAIVFNLLDERTRKITLARIRRRSNKLTVTLKRFIGFNMTLDKVDRTTEFECEFRRKQIASVDYVLSQLLITEYFRRKFQNVEHSFEICNSKSFSKLSSFSVVKYINFKVAVCDQSIHQTGRDLESQQPETSTPFFRSSQRPARDYEQRNTIIQESIFLNCCQEHR